jgi:hypothetical protein
MTFELSDFSITTIGYGEPTLWVAIALASVVAFLVGHVLGSTIGRVRDRWRRRVYGIPASGAVFVSLVVLTVMILDGLFSHYHRGMVCTVFVTPVLFIPGLVALAVERVAWRRAGEAQAG